MNAAAGSAGLAPAARDVLDWPGHFGRMGAGYADRAFDGAALAALGAAELDLVLARLGDGHGRRVLDVGAGTGRFSAALAARGWQVTALDGAPEMLECIARDVPSATRVHGMLGEPLPFADATFDAVVAMRVVKYVRDTDAALGELARVARPGAPVVFDLANPVSLARWGYGRSPMGFVRPARVPSLCAAAGLVPEGVLEGPRLPHAVLARARHPLAARATRAVERTLSRLTGAGRGRLSRSVVVATTRA